MLQDVTTYSPTKEIIMQLSEDMPHHDKNNNTHDEWYYVNTASKDFMWLMGFTLTEKQHHIEKDGSGSSSLVTPN